MSKINYYMSAKQRKKYEKAHSNSINYNNELKVKEVDKGIILPAKKDTSSNPKLWAIGGVVDKNFHFVEESNTSYLFGGNYEVNEDFIDYIDEEVIFFGPFIQHWGHFICDQIGRLWYLIANNKKIKVAYCGWNWDIGNSDMYGNYLEFFELLGIDKENLINVKNPTQFKKVIIPDFSIVGGKYVSNEFQLILDKLVENALLDKSIKYPEKVYLSRLNLKNDKEKGEEHIIELLKKNNFEIRYPEEMSLKEQIVYFNKCKIISMISGSIAHNLLFAKNENKAIIFNKTNLLNNYQNVIDNVTKANIDYIDSYFSLFSVLFGEGPFLLRINKYVKKYFANNNYDISNISSMTIKEFNWYLKKYRKTYKDPVKKMWLKSQKESMKKI